MLPPYQSKFRKGWGTMDPVVCFGKRNYKSPNQQGISNGIILGCRKGLGYGMERGTAD